MSRMVVPEGLNKSLNLLSTEYMYIKREVSVHKNDRLEVLP